MGLARRFRGQNLHLTSLSNVQPILLWRVYLHGLMDHTIADLFVDSNRTRRLFSDCRLTKEMASTRVRPHRSSAPFEDDKKCFGNIWNPKDNYCV